jgi:hypothetical protein
MQYIENFSLTQRSLCELRKNLQKTASYSLFWLSFNKFLNLERDHLEDPGVDGRIILRWVFRNLGNGMGVMHGLD